MGRTSDGEGDDKHELSKIERSINFICDLENQQGKRDDSADFICDADNPFQSPISSPKLETEPSRKRKHEGLRECFLEALSQNSSHDVNYDVEVKMEKEDETDQLAYQTDNQFHSIDQSSNLTTSSTAKRKKNDIRIKNFFETMADTSRGMRDEMERGFVDSLQNKLYNIGEKLDQLGEKYDKLIELKKEQIEEMRKDREERRRHNLEIEFYNRTLLALKSKKDLVL